MPNRRKPLARPSIGFSDPFALMDPHRYFDHAATSFPKPDGVAEAVAAHLHGAAGNPGRGGHELAVAAARTIFDTRIAVAAAVGREQPERVAFTASATAALNMALSGCLRPGDHVVASTVEHNAVARPLRRLIEERSIEVSWVPAGPDGSLEPPAVAEAVREETRLVAVTAASNVLGARTDIPGIRGAIGAAPFLLVDGAQLVGSAPVAMDRWGVDLLAVPGHKGLQGPQGIGALAVSDRVEFRPWIEGGTGADSRAATTPATWPDGFEAGTPNGPGIAGLLAALEHLEIEEPSRLLTRKLAVWRVLVDGLSETAGVRIHSCLDPNRALPLVSFSVDTLSPGEVAHRLATVHDIAVRAGLHCAPDAHGTTGSLESGLVRASIGPVHKPADAEFFVAALQQILAGG